MRNSPQLFLCVLLLVLASDASPQSTNPAHQPGLSGDLVQVASQLQRLKTTIDGWPATDVPSIAQGLLPQLKAGLRAIALQVLNRHPGASPEDLRAFLIADIKAAGIEVLSSRGAGTVESEEERFGFVYDVRVQRPSGHPELIAVVFTLTIPCGTDDSLTLFENEGSEWRPLVVAESNSYSEVSGAQGGLDYALSPADANGGWFLVTANTTPWCTSNWQGLHYRVLRPSDSPEAPRVLLDEHRGVYLGVDDPFRLTVRQDGFQVGQMDSQSLDAGLLTRVHVQQYKVEGDRVVRVAPLALLPEDFLDEWVNLSWEDALPWTSGFDLAQLHAWHDRLSRSGSDENLFTEFDFVQPCPSKGPELQWQIGLTLEQSSGGDRIEHIPAELFFTVVKHDEAFYIVGVATKRPNGCPGQARALSSTLHDLP